MSHLQHQVLEPRCGDQLIGLRNGARHRLFDQEMHILLQQLQRYLVMIDRWRSDHRGIDSINQFAVMLKRFALTFRCDLVPSLSRRINHADQLDILQ